MDFLQQSFSVDFHYNVYFTQQLFSRSNPLLKEVLKGAHQAGTVQKILFVVDENVVLHFPDLLKQVDGYFEGMEMIKLVPEHILVAGGETAKNEGKYFARIVEAINHYGIDRHSYIAAIGGGSVLDLVGYAAAVSHRGIRHIRIPTTVLSQNDSGIGVKNGINYKGKKNFLGTFAPPFAVFNDSGFLTTLSDRDWVSGIAEAIKVALIKNESFFYWLEAHAGALVERDREAMDYLIKECARLHMEHIASGDPFEFGSSRPLDFGHWSAHKLEQISGFEILHGEAVAMGIAQDSLYSTLAGLLSIESAERIVQLLIKMRLPVTHPLMVMDRDDHPLFLGLTEFQEHLGGQLTIMLLEEIGKGVEVHELSPQLIMDASNRLQNFEREDHLTAGK